MLQNARQDWLDYGSNYMNYPQFYFNVDPDPAVGLNWSEFYYLREIGW